MALNPCSKCGEFLPEQAETCPHCGGSTKSTRGLRTVMGMSVSVALGVTVGVATDNLALWISVGLALGFSVGALGKSKATRRQTDETTKE